MPDTSEVIKLPRTYKEKIRFVFHQLCKKNGGASPSEVTREMHKRKWLAASDTVIDIADLMNDMRKKGVM